MGAIEQQDAIMQGVARYMGWRREFLSSWQDTLQQGQLKQAWAMMPPAMKDWLKKNDPQGYKRALSVLQGDNDG